MAATPPTLSPSPCPLPVQNADGGIPLLLEGERPLKTRVILVGIGGATCSGKTTLAKHLRNILPNSFIIHQDDFAPPQETLPVVMGWQDWDSAPTAIDWPRFRAFLHTVKTTASIPADHSSHDHLNEQKKVDLEGAIAQRWQQYFEQAELRAEAEGARIVWGLVDGFLLYWDPEVIAALDAKFFLRVPFETLVERREARQGYYTAEGAFWRDPPEYFEKLVYPCYVEAHKHIFENGDIDHGATTLPGLEVIDALDIPMSDIVERCCGRLKDVLAQTS